jgi:ADP-heptose:LPS heptosyltransferase
MKQKITLKEGVVTVGMMRPFHPSNGARNTPAVKLSRLQQLIQSKHPHICVVRGEGIGDVLTITPTLHALKETFPKLTLTVATNTSYLDGALVKVLQYNPDIDHILERDLIDDMQYDLVINLHCPAVKNEKPGKMPPNRIDVFANHAGIKLKDPVPRYYPQKDEIEYGEILMQGMDPRQKTVLVQPFASSAKRSFDTRRIKQALASLNQSHGIQSLVLTHDGDTKDVLWDNIPGCRPLHNLDIRQIAGVMVHCDMVLCPDSSILHLAGAMGVPTVGLFGPTPPQIRINHYKKAIAIWHGADIPACPCWYDHCPTGYTCMERITTGDIEESILKHLKNTQRVNIVDVLNNVKPIQIETEIV